MSKTFTPHTYQERMVEWLYDRRRSAVWAPMGGGKTGTSLFALETVALAHDPFPALVLAPLRVANSTWPAEVTKWANFAHLRVSPISARRDPTKSATAKERLAALNTPADVYTLPYDGLAWLREALDGRWPFRTVVADELTRLKGFRLRQGTARAQALAKMMSFSNEERFIGLTGTPAPNGVKDLWGQMYFIDRGERLGRSFSAFEMRWFTKGYDGYSLVPRDGAQEEIQALLKDICLTVDGLPVDEPIENVISVDLPPKAREQYRQMEREAFLALEREGVGRAGAALASGAPVEIEAVNAAVKINKCVQIANGFVFHEGGKEYEVLHDAKLEALESVVEEANGMPVLASYTFVPVQELVRRRFRQARLLDADPDTIRQWNAGRIGLLLAHPQSAGHGLNLQDGGNILADVGATWNLEHDAQIIERIGPLRQKQSGYDRPVFRHRIVAKDTFEDRVILPRMKSKQSVQEALLAAMRETKR